MEEHMRISRLLRIGAAALVGTLTLAAFSIVGVSAEDTQSSEPAIIKFTNRMMMDLDGTGIKEFPDLSKYRFHTSVITRIPCSLNICPHQASHLTT